MKINGQYIDDKFTSITYDKLNRCGIITIKIPQNSFHASSAFIAIEYLESMNSIIKFTTGGRLTGYFLVKVKFEGSDRIYEVVFKEYNIRENSAGVFSKLGNDIAEMVRIIGGE